GQPGLGQPPGGRPGELGARADGGRAHPADGAIVRPGPRRPGGVTMSQVPSPGADAAGLATAQREDAGPADVRIVLFGMPAAGKPSRLAGLGRAPRPREPCPRGKLIARPGALAELARQLYDAPPRRTAEEVVPYPVPFPPAPRPGEPPPRPIEAVLM